MMHARSLQALDSDRQLLDEIILTMSAVLFDVFRVDSHLCKPRTTPVARYSLFSPAFDPKPSIRGLVQIAQRAGFLFFFLPA